MISKITIIKHLFSNDVKTLNMNNSEESIWQTVKQAELEHTEFLIVVDCKIVKGIIQTSLFHLPNKIYSFDTINHNLCRDFLIINEENLEDVLANDSKAMYLIIEVNGTYNGLIVGDSIKAAGRSLNSKSFDIVLNMWNQSDKIMFMIDHLGEIVLVNKNAVDFCGNRVKLLGKLMNSFLTDINEQSFVAEYIHMDCSEESPAGIITIQGIGDWQKIRNELDVVKSNEKYCESIIENSYDGIYTTDSKGLTLSVNKAYERITGIDRDKLIGRYMKDLVAEGLLSTYITDDVVSQKEPVTLTQTIKNGKKVIITGSPIFDNDGDVVQVITNVRDITELINLEKKLSISYETSSFYQDQLFKDIASNNIVCDSREFSEAMDLAKKVSKKDSTVLILGETGSGKEIIARYIHLSSNRKDRPYIKINCGSIPSNLLESELFGYAPGAFTGANTKGKSGMFELADGGTIFLDEIGEIPIEVQSTLLQVLQDGVVTRIGDTKSKKVNTRVITATNRNLNDMILSGQFRSDLYYRLNVVSIYVPPLRERLDDIPKLAELFIAQLNEKYNETKLITSSFINQLKERPWPGNVREMGNFIEKQFVIANFDVIDTIVENPRQETVETSDNASAVTIQGIIPLSEAVREVEAILLERAMGKARTTYKAAALLNISQPTFYRKYKEFQKSKKKEDNSDE